MATVTITIECSGPTGETTATYAARTGGTGAFDSYTLAEHGTIGGLYVFSGDYDDGTGVRPDGPWAVVVGEQMTVVDIETGTDAYRLDGSVNVGALNGSSSAAANLQASCDSMEVCLVDTVVNTHTPTTTEFQSDSITEANADQFIGRVVRFTSGTLAGQEKLITDYALVGGIGQFTVEALTDAPANNDTFLII